MSTITSSGTEVLRFTLSVTADEDDVAKGCQKQAGRCPLARALKRVFVKHTGQAGLRSVLVGNMRASVGLWPDADSIIVQASLPKELRNLITRYDRSQPCPAPWGPYDLTFEAVLYPNRIHSRNARVEAYLEDHFPRYTRG